MANKPTISTWEFKDKYVDPRVFTQDDGSRGNFISSESIVICAAPPEVPESIDENKIIPIGVLESAAVIQNKQVQQLFEIGGRKSYMIPGRTRVQVALSRVFFNGSTLMGALTESVDGDDYELKDAGFDTNDDPDAPERFYMNLASSFFNKPHGLVLVFNDSEDEAVGAVWLENCNITYHRMAFRADQTIIMEDVQIICDRLVPLKMD